jgi:hypothetical protein
VTTSPTPVAASDWQPFQEPLRATLTRTFGIANWLRPRLPRDRGVRIVARLALWFLRGRGAAARSAKHLRRARLTSLSASPSTLSAERLMVLQTRIVTGVLISALVACTGAAERAPATDSGAAAPSVARDSTHASPSAPPAAAPGTTATAPLPAGDSSVTERGLGPLRVGMTLAEARRALGGALVVPKGTDTTGCAYLTWRDGPRGTRVMIDGGRIARVDVDSANVATTAGARVGDSEERIQQLYPGRVTVTPHKYVDGHYLTVNAVGDSSAAIVFETEKGKVTRYRAGRRPAVEYVEGCG